MTVIDLAGAIGGILTVIVFVVYVVVQARLQAPDRVAEQEAREHFTRHGVWPEERPRRPTSRGLRGRLRHL